MPRCRPGSGDDNQGTARPDVRHDLEVTHRARTQVAVDRELADMGATPDEVASTFTVMAAAMLVEACGSKAEATALAARWITARSAQAVNARDASAA